MVSVTDRIVIAPSLLAADFARLGEEAAAVERAGADWLHLDVMDGHFVPNITFGPLVVKALRPHTSLPLDVHLMIAPADPYIAAFAEAGADHISVHPEAGPHLHRTLQLIRSFGKKAGIVLNPATPVDAIAYVLDLADLIMVMTVNPGFGGQAFIASQLEKIATIRRMIDATGRDIALQVDGGITPKTASQVLAAGADTLIAGTSVFGAADYAQAIADLRAAAAPRRPQPGDQRRMNGLTARGSITRGARGLFAKLQNLRAVNYPDAPALAVRDPWPGDPSRGVRLIKGELSLLGASRNLPAGAFSGTGGASALLRATTLGFTWLRDLRALGTDAARARARAMVSDFMDTADPDPLAYRADVTGARIAAWLGHYDFFAASADDDFRQRLMSRLVTDARNLAAALPAEEHDGRALTALKGLIAASVAMPEHAAYSSRAMRFLPQEIAHQLLPDGCHIERSPAAHLAALQDLTEIRALLQIGKIEPPEALPMAIDRMALALRALRHGDGGLALFNGTREDLPSLVDLVLSQAGRSGRAPGQIGESGFHRLAAGRSVLIVDAGAPAPAGADRFAHAGTLGFEFSAGKERLIVNCGAAPASGAEWRDALRATDAHSTLIIAGVSSSEIRENGLGRRPAHVTGQRQAAGGAHWLEASHDGWDKLFGAIHHRRLYLSESGEDLRGEDLIEAEQPQPFMIRFHLHPNVTASLQQDNEAVLLRLPSGQAWRLRADGTKISIEESVYFGTAEARRAEQIILAGHQDGPQQVKWAITKLG